MNILCVAPFAPPLNHAEPIQVYRILEQLLATDRVDLVSEPIFGSWSSVDDAFVLSGPKLRRLELAMPAHSVMMRLAGHRVARPVSPLLDHWLALFARRVLRWSSDFDCIYTRSFPTRAALLGRALKRRSGKPWIMHLSDPWADNSEAGLGSLARRIAEHDERACFADADRITLTTEAQADHYRRKYPFSAARIAVTPNVLPAGATRMPTRFDPNGTIELVLAGSLYGRRSIGPLLGALAALPADVRDCFRLTVAGNAIDSEVAALLQAGHMVSYRGLVSYREVLRLQEGGNILVTVEPPRASDRDGQYLLSKLLDYLPTGKPILAITSSGSVTEQIVRPRFGWSVDVGDVAAIADLLGRIARGEEARSIAAFATELPESLRAEAVARDLRLMMESLT